MKITRSQLKEIIKEEIENAIDELDEIDRRGFLKGIGKAAAAGAGAAALGALPKSAQAAEKGTEEDPIELPGATVTAKAPEMTGKFHPGGFLKQQEKYNNMVSSYKGVTGYNDPQVEALKKMTDKMFSRLDTVLTNLAMEIHGEYSGLRKFK